MKPADNADSLNRFDGRAQLYSAHRPGYPPAAITALLEGMTVQEVLAADIGAGTGISARLLAERGVPVIAIEPNADMRAAAAPHPLISWRQGTGEQTGLDAGSVNLILCAQSFHWMQPRAALDEFVRVLRPAGRIGLLWYALDLAAAGMDEYRQIIEAHAVRRPTSPSHTRAHEQAQQPLQAHPMLGNVRRRDFHDRQQLPLSGLIGRSASSSYCPMQGPKLEALAEALQTFFERQATAEPGAPEHINLEYEVVLFLAERQAQ